MRDRLDLILSQWNRERRRSGRRKLGLSLLSLLVAMSTLFALLLPAFTLEKPVFCGKEEHRHDESCYERELICGLEEGEGHVHTEDCYTWEPTLICGLEESEEHSHTEDCYVLTPVLTCGLEECEGHVHTEDCYEQRLVCGLEEHEHELACYSDPGAVESEAYWKASLPQFDDESPKERLLAIAASQLGYRESSLNYCVLEDMRAAAPAGPTRSRSGGSTLPPRTISPRRATWSSSTMTGTGWPTTWASPAGWTASPAPCRPSRATGETPWSAAAIC